jgi:hypothetical protein
MVEAVKSWFKENSTLMTFLFAQAAALLVAGGSMIAYYH